MHKTCANEMDSIESMQKYIHRMPWLPAQQNKRMEQKKRKSVYIVNPVWHDIYDHLGFMCMYVASIFARDARI